MYAKEITNIELAFEDKPVDTVIRVVEFVLATIQQQFHTVPAILKDWDKNGKESATMWGMKKDGFQHIIDNADRITALLTYESSKCDTIGAIDTLLEVPGLNTVKAGFAAQLLGFEVGCIDVQNARLYGIENLDAFKVTPQHTARTRLAKIESYVVLCNKLGGSGKLWDTWCHFIANQYPEHFIDGEAVSELHSNTILRRR